MILKIGNRPQLLINQHLRRLVLACTGVAAGVLLIKITNRPVSVRQLIHLPLLMAMLMGIAKSGSG